MPKIYTLQQKQHAKWMLKHIDDTPTVSEMTGIPVRTLFNWKSDYRIAAVKDPYLDYEGGNGTLTIREIRDHLLKQIEKLVKNPTDDPRKAYFASLAIDRHLTQIRQLNDILQTPHPPLDESPS